MKKSKLTTQNVVWQEVARIYPDKKEEVDKNEICR